MNLGTGRDWAELLRVSALFTVPGDALAGAAATGLRPNRSTLLAIAASLALYEAGMALNDWADREEDAIERPHRPLPSGRIAPPVALGAAAALTAGGLGLAAAAGRPALTVASGLAATVWAYDLGLKHTPAGPAAMAAARALDLLLGAAATSAPTAARRGSPAGRLVPGLRVRQGKSGEGAIRSGRPVPPRPGAVPGLRAAIPTALVLGAHTLAVTAVSRREAQGGSTTAPLCALAATVALAQLLARNGRGDAGAGTGAGTGAGSSQLPVGRRAAATRGLPGSTLVPPTSGAPTIGTVVASVRVPVGRPAGRPVGQPVGRLAGQPAGIPVGRSAGRAGSPGGVPGSASGRPGGAWRTGARGAVQFALAATYAATAARPLFHAALNPSPQLTQRAVGGGIRAMIPLQAALSARTGALGSALLTAALAPAARKFGRKVSVT
ncbi:SCO3242 family prenyltransferase [Streptomyces sp. NPDC057302]|uniref:SCO3242 family prenyltransferase n=1 Tax=Streptomyces sp. NPDC057302 TaxID=3346094 RepID=UPI0036293E07